VAQQDPLSLPLRPGRRPHRKEHRFRLLPLRPGPPLPPLRRQPPNQPRRFPVRRHRAPLRPRELDLPTRFSHRIQP
jgi:hypothetical protein